MSVLKPVIGDRLVFHSWNDEHFILLYVFRRSEGAHVVLDLDQGVLVDVGQFTEGITQGTFEFYAEWAKE